MNHHLLTLDEARDLVGAAAIEVADRAPRHRVPDLLRGRGNLRGLGSGAQRAVRAYRAALRRVRAVGLGWIIDDQVEGALSYVGVDSEAGQSALVA